MPDILAANGEEFLWLYAPAVLVALAAAVALRRFLLRGPRPAADAGPLNHDEAALLAGGLTTLADSALAALVNANAIKVAGGALHRAGPFPRNASMADALLAALAQQPKPFTVAQARQAVEQFPDAHALLESLKARGLLLKQRDALRAIALPAAIVLASLAVGVLKMALSDPRHTPVGAIMLIGVVQLACLAFCLRPPSRLTPAGSDALAGLRKAHASLETINVRELASLPPRDMQMAHALFGDAVLRGTLANLPPLLHAKFEPAP